MKTIPDENFPQIEFSSISLNQGSTDQNRLVQDQKTRENQDKLRPRLENFEKIFHPLFWYRPLSYSHIGYFDAISENDKIKKNRIFLISNFLKSLIEECNLHISYIQYNILNKTRSLNSIKTKPFISKHDKQSELIS